MRGICGVGCDLNGKCGEARLRRPGLDGQRKAHEERNAGLLRQVVLIALSSFGDQAGIAEVAGLSLALKDPEAVPGPCGEPFSRVWPGMPIPRNAPTRLGLPVLQVLHRTTFFRAVMLRPEMVF